MSRYEYKVVPAPKKGVKVKGVKTPEARFAYSVEDMLNQMGQDRWEYLRSELLPSEERSGLRSTQTVWRSVLIFRRAIEPADVAVPEEPETAKEDVSEPILDESERIEPAFARPALTLTGTAAAEPVVTLGSDGDQSDSAPREPADPADEMVDRTMTGIELEARRKTDQSQDQAKD